MIGHLGWETLAARRNNIKLQNDVSYISCTCRGRLVEVADHVHNTDTWVPPGELCYIPLISPHQIMPINFLFLPNTIPIWNNCPLEAVSVPNLPTFRRCLTKFQEDGVVLNPLHCTSLHFIVTPFFFGLHFTTLFSTSASHYTSVYSAHHTLSEECSLFTIRRREVELVHFHYFALRFLN